MRGGKEKVDVFFHFFRSFELLHTFEIQRKEQQLNLQLLYKKDWNMQIDMELVKKCLLKKITKEEGRAEKNLFFISLFSFFSSLEYFFLLLVLLNQRLVPSPFFFFFPFLVIFSVSFSFFPFFYFFFLKENKRKQKNKPWQTCLSFDLVKILIPDSQTPKQDRYGKIVVLR